jgi:DNA helicase-2/ATP-dependent DNA helicase PcrA
VEASYTPRAGISLRALYAYYEDRDWMRPYLDSLRHLLAMTGQMRPYAAINYIRQGGGYDTFLEDWAKTHRVDAGELAAVADEVQENAAQCKDLKEFEETIRHTREMMEQLREAEQEKKDCVTLATLHGAKGLEFEEVFLLNVNEGIIPYHRAGLEAEREEERRLFYVGMTRAKRKLHLLYLKERFGKKQEPSRFLECLRR